MHVSKAWIHMGDCARQIKSPKLVNIILCSYTCDTWSKYGALKVLFNNVYRVIIIMHDMQP